MFLYTAKQVYSYLKFFAERSLIKFHLNVEQKGIEEISLK